MKVAISAQSNDIDSLVDPRFGRARWLIIADSETGQWQAHDNADNVNASGGAGVQAANTVAAQSVQALITGNVGPNAHKALAAGDIAIYQVGNGVSVRDALGALGRGELTAVEGPTMSGHWS
ncbi:MAG: dinitrogenase iron-molybdenum cofactor biosynthesis protein [Actinobacteria bacterium]|nr:dinitrogenase iron-molybdenum cofactor biosynthesis protein [Actinomycetota bacterium]